MSFMSFFRRSKPVQSSDTSDTERPPCLICAELDKWNAYHRRPHQTIGRATHGGGSRTGPNDTWLEWSACYEHYQVITALYWLVTIGQMDSPLYITDIVKYMTEERDKYCNKPCCREPEDDEDDEDGHQSN